MGILVIPPTITISSISFAVRPASLRAVLHGGSVLEIKSSTKASNLALVIFRLICFGPVLSAVIKGKLTSVCSAEQTDVNLPFITADKTGPKHINLKMTRAKLEALVEDLISRTLPPCKTALKDAGLTANEIDEIVMVGGMTRMPKVPLKLKTFLVKSQIKV